MEINLSHECKTDLLQYARSTIGNSLGLSDPPKFKEKWPILDKTLGLFVTLTIDGNLRGCIGYIESPNPVSKSLGELANSAAFSDPRFPALSESEYSDIHIEITLLSIPRKIADIEEIKVGTHGLIISRGYQRGLLLPQVATEHKMDRIEFLNSTCRKAGLSPGAWKEDDVEIETFEGYIFSEQ